MKPIPVSSKLPGAVGAHIPKESPGVTPEAVEVTVGPSVRVDSVSITGIQVSLLALKREL